MVFSPWASRRDVRAAGQGHLQIILARRPTGLLLSALEAYGQERGRRMAARCAQRRPHRRYGLLFRLLRMVLAGQRENPAGTRLSLRELPHTRLPLHSAWKESGLAEYGYFYCRCVDQAILRGFNPALRLSLPTCLTRNERQGCAFHWESAENTPALFDRQRRLEKRLGGSQVKDFCYHTAHLYSTILRCARDLDPAAASAAEADAADAFAARYGPEALRLVRQAARQDFTVV